MHSLMIVVTVRKRSCGKVMFFTPVCHFVPEWRGPPLDREPILDRDPPPHPAATEVGGTHATGMHTGQLSSKPNVLKTL